MFWILKRHAQLLRDDLKSVVVNCRKPEQWARWRGDFFGGTVAALIAAPYGIALAIAIGLKPEAGLYTSIIGGLISGIISDSPVVVSGLSATVVPVLVMLVKTYGTGAALAAGVLSGLIMTVVGILRLGRFIHYLPQSVIGAFTSGLGVVIISTQIKAVFGVKPSPAGFDLGVVDEFWAVARSIGHLDLHTAGIAAIVIAVIFILPRWRSNAPAPLIGVIIASIVAYLCSWQIPRVGALPDNFPKPSLTAVDFSNFSDLIYPAFTLSGLIIINQLLTLVVTDRLSEARGVVKFNRELVAQGVANIACPFFGAPPGVAMLARTVASARAGAISRWSVFAHSLVLVLFLLPFSGLIAQIPLAALAGVTVAIGLQLVGLERFRALRQMDRADATVFLLTFFLVVFSDLIVGVGIGSLLAMMLFIERAAQSTQVEQIRPEQGEQEPLEANSRPGSDIMQSEVQIYRLTGPLFFASSERVLRRLTREVTAKTLVLDLTEAGPIDSAATDCLRRIAQRQRKRGGELYLIGLDRRLFAFLAKDGLLKELGAAIRRDEDAYQGSRYDPFLKTILDVSKQDVSININPVLRSGGK